ncbi:hypothetical protein ACFLYZ_02335, partial [Thermodesulfobacteriota bacterium]
MKILTTVFSLGSLTCEFQIFYILLSVGGAFFSIYSPTLIDKLCFFALKSYSFIEKLAMNLEINLENCSIAPYIVYNHQNYTVSCVFFFTIRKLPAIYIWIYGFVNR